MTGWPDRWHVQVAAALCVITLGCDGTASSEAAFGSRAH